MRTSIERDVVGSLVRLDVKIGRLEVCASMVFLVLREHNGADNFFLCGPDLRLDGHFLT
jgi:hypothetical protein